MECRVLEGATGALVVLEDAVSAVLGATRVAADPQVVVVVATGVVMVMEELLDVVVVMVGLELEALGVHLVVDWVQWDWGESVEPHLAQGGALAAGTLAPVMQRWQDQVPHRSLLHLCVSTASLLRLHGGATKQSAMFCFGLLSCSVSAHRTLRINFAYFIF